MRVRDTGTILLWGLRADPPLEAVRDALHKSGCPVTVLDQRAVLDTEVELVAGTSVEGRLRIKDKSFHLGAVKAVYLRPQDWRELPNVARAGPQSELWRHALAVHDVLLSWADLTPAVVLNRPAPMAANSSKPYQAAWIESLGFRIPDTLLTTDPDAALEFWRHHGQVIYKSVSGIRSIVSRLTAEHRQRFDDIASCPTQFQEYIPGTEHRVHVVGDEVFACKIISDADDYRYSSEAVDMQSCELPGEISDLCKRLTKSMDLLLAGLDLRCTPQGDWYCFEVNSSPAFTCFDALTGQRVTEAVARLLASGLEEGGPASYGDYPPRQEFRWIEDLEIRHC
jgi:hypothetical protein